MTCAEVQRILPDWEGTQDGELGAHLKSCPACSELVSDLQFISRESRQLAASDEPAPRLWVRIAADLRSEGIIREPEAAKLATITSRRRWKVWWPVAVAAALLAGASYIVSHRPAPTVAEKPPLVQSPAVETPLAHPPVTVAQTPRSQASPSENSVGLVVEPPPSAEDQQFLSEVSQRAPSMRAAYEDQLRSVNAYIREAQAYLDRNPEDADARQHLMEAYQQKALLYQLALDHIQ